LGVTFRIAVPATVSAAAAPIVVVIVTRPRAGEPAFVVPRRHIIAAIIIIVAIAATRTATLVPAAPRCLGVALGIAVPAAMPAAAPPIIIVVIVTLITRPRAHEPAFIVAYGHRAAAIIVAIAAARTATFVPAATGSLGVALGIAVPAAAPMIGTVPALA
jgi:hypothetical protein